MSRATRLRLAVVLPALFVTSARVVGNDLTILGDYALGPGATLIMEESRLRVGGDVDIAIDSVTRFNMSAASLELIASPDDGVQDVELLSEDVGCDPSQSDASRWLINLFRIHRGFMPSYVRLVDEHDNDPRGTAPEVLYVNQLVLDEGAALDLAGRTLYYEVVTPANPFAPNSGVTVMDSVGGGRLVQIANTPPMLTVPAPISVHSDAGECQATFTTMPQATATDDSDTDVMITFTRSDGKPTLLAPYEAADSPIAITWRAQDDCGNTATGVQTITVSNSNEILVDVELTPTLDPVGMLRRCITFELWDCPGSSPSRTLQKEVDFPATGAPPHRANGVSLLTPCGVPVECMTARDKLHTLRSRAPDLTDAGAVYRATFVGNRATGGHWLVPGNLNNDRFIDILDFGTFVARFQFHYGTGNTDCSTPLFHADLSGDGLVFTSDFSFMAIHFIQIDESNCCGQPNLDGESVEPVTSISVPDLWRRGLGELAAADLSADGVLDERDMAAFAAGANLADPQIETPGSSPRLQPSVPPSPKLDRVRETAVPG